MGAQIITPSAGVLPYPDWTELASSSPTIAITGIPLGTYKKIVMELVGRGTAAATAGVFSGHINNVTVANVYRGTHVYTIGGTQSIYYSLPTDTMMKLGYIPQNTANAGYMSYASIEITWALMTTVRMLIKSRYALRFNDTAASVIQGFANYQLMANTVEPTQLVLQPDAGSFAAGTWYRLLLKDKV